MSLISLCVCGIFCRKELIYLIFFNVPIAYVKSFTFFVWSNLFDLAGFKLCEHASTVECSRICSKDDCNCNESWLLVRSKGKTSKEWETYTIEHLVWRKGKRNQAESLYGVHGYSFKWVAYVHEILYKPSSEKPENWIFLFVDPPYSCFLHISEWDTVHRLSLFLKGISHPIVLVLLVMAV